MLLTLAIGTGCATSEWDELDEMQMIEVGSPPSSALAPAPEDSLGPLLPPVSSGRAAAGGPAVSAELRHWEDGAYY